MPYICTNHILTTAYHPKPCSNHALSMPKSRPNDVIAKQLTVVIW